MGAMSHLSAARSRGALRARPERARPLDAVKVATWALAVGGCVAFWAGVAFILWGH